MQITLTLTLTKSCVFSNVNTKNMKDLQNSLVVATRCYTKRSLCHGTVSVCPSVCPSVCLSVRLSVCLSGCLSRSVSYANG